MKAFYNFSSFETEFNNFLDTVIIEDDECEEGSSIIETGIEGEYVSSDKTDCEGIIKFENSYMNIMYSEYIKRIRPNANQENAKTERRIVAVRAKPRNP